MSVRSCACALALLVVLLPGRASAGRPLQTEDTGTVEPGTVEVVTRAEFVKSPGERTAVGLLSATIGLLPRMDGHIDVSGFGVSRDDAPGRADSRKPPSGSSTGSSTRPSSGRPC